MLTKASGSGERWAGRDGLFAGHRLLEISGLWALGVVEPLLGLLGGNAPFLVFHRVDRLDLVAFCALVVAGPVLVLWGLEALVERLAGRARAERTHVAVLALLAVLLLVGMARKLGDPLPLWALLPIAAGVFWVTFEGALRMRGLRRFSAWLSLALPIVVLIFWQSSAVRSVGVPERSSVRAAPEGIAESVSADRGAVAASGSDQRSLPEPVPVILVVFDELPLLSLLDADLGIDRGLCPNFARFAESATWFRNASTVWSLTNQSIASLLTGEVVDRDTPPTRRSLPQNLLTWLEATHRVSAFEISTSFGPPTSPGLEPPPPRRRRILSLTADSVAIAGHLLVPAELEHLLPPIDNGWGGFWRSRVVPGRPGTGGGQSDAAPWAFALADGRAQRFRTFLASIGGLPASAPEPPSAHFIHLMLPHMPYRYLPSGAVYGGRPVQGDAAASWAAGGWFALETYQRHLLQVGFVDRLVGELIERLEQVGLWDRAVVVLVADHGVSHWPGEDRRKPSGTDHPEDIWRVPLLIKAPGQRDGRIDDRPVSSLDVVPTVAALLGARIPWDGEGASLVGDEVGPGGREIAADGGVIRRDLGRSRPGYGPGLERKLELFDPAAGAFRWVGLGPYGRWIGRPVGDLEDLERHGAECAGEVDQAPVVASFDPDSDYSPAWLTGEVECDVDIPGGAFVLAAVNGRVAGSGELVRARGARALFSAMTAESVWRAGTNALELYLVAGPSEEPRVEAIELR